MSWVAIEGYEGRYSVSENGEVMSWKFAKSSAARQLKQRMVRRYMTVCLRKPGSKGKTFSVHCLVAAAFIGPRPQGKYVNHIDGNRKNNALQNLEYVTASENQRHSFRIGLQCNKGEQHSRHKLTNEQVVAIMSRIKSGEKQTSIANDFGVDASNISHIKRGKLWAHVTHAGKVG